MKSAERVENYPLDPADDLFIYFGEKKTLHSPISFCPRCSTLSEIYVESVRVLATPKEKRET